MFRSKQLITLLNRFGHSENYSFGLQLETSIANAEQVLSFISPPEIVRNPRSGFVFHSEFDNFDKLVKELYGPGIVNYTHGIKLQGLKSDEVSDTIIEEVPKTREKGTLTMTTLFHYPTAILFTGKAPCWLSNAKNMTTQVKFPLHRVKEICFGFW